MIIDGWSTDTVTVRGVSQRGHLHRYNGAPRQDDFAVHLLPGGRIIVLVADGVSAAPQSHLGASAAIKYAASWLRDRLPDDIRQTDWLMLIKSVAWGLSEQAQNLLHLDQPDPVRAEQELATTLVCAVIEPTISGALRAFLIGVGDSAAWLLSAGRFIEVLGGKPSSTSEIASSAVTALPWVPNEIAAAVIEIGDGDVLLVGTDGIGDPLGNGEGGVGNLLRSVLGEAIRLREFCRHRTFLD
ncbi:protein phosphatase 2C domain-containing protein [Mycobacterium mantenii]|uniref:protein phosphatase 2C domain-containing protein n=1 Tax=Mycobacterium mantenii TaxID=560555 RepID=UPI0013F4F535|nr:protein phosphatase 2C domain-containing protein [Mycobacterium mantenii]